MNQDTEPSEFKAWTYLLVSRIFGLTFAIRLMEKSEAQAQISYRALSNLPGVKKIIKDEDKHEEQLVGMVN